MKNIYIVFITIILEFLQTQTTAAKVGFTRMLLLERHVNFS